MSATVARLTDAVADLSVGRTWKRVVGTPRLREPADAGGFLRCLSRDIAYRMKNLAATVIKHFTLDELNHTELDVGFHKATLRKSPPQELRPSYR